MGILLLVLFLGGVTVILWRRYPNLDVSTVHNNCYIYRRGLCNISILVAPIIYLCYHRLLVKLSMYRKSFDFSYLYFPYLNFPYSETLCICLLRLIQFLSLKANHINNKTFIILSWTPTTVIFVYMIKTHITFNKSSNLEIIK